MGDVMNFRFILLNLPGKGGDVVAPSSSSSTVMRLGVKTLGLSNRNFPVLVLRKASSNDAMVTSPSRDSMLSKSPARP